MMNQGAEENTMREFDSESLESKMRHQSLNLTER